MEKVPFDWSWITTPLGTGAGLALGYIFRNIFDKRKKTAEDEGAELDADTKAVELYERFAAQLNPRLEILQKKQDELIQTVSELKLENTELRIQNKQLKHENDALKKDMSILHNEIKTLRNQLNS